MCGLFDNPLNVIQESQSKSIKYLSNRKMVVPTLSEYYFHILEITPASCTNTDSIISSCNRQLKFAYEDICLGYVPKYPVDELLAAKEYLIESYTLLAFRN